MGEINDRIIARRIQQRADENVALNEKLSGTPPEYRSTVILLAIHDRLGQLLDRLDVADR